MTKIAATKANAVTTSTRDGQDHGTASGFAGLGSAGDSDVDQSVPNTRDSKGNPSTSPNSFSGGSA